MAYENNNLTSRQSDVPEQIDLIDLFLQLWRGKWTIIVCVVIAVAAAGVYLTVAKEKWTSTAVITMPDAGQIAGYTNAMNVLNGDTNFKILDIQQQVIGRFSSSFSALAQALQNQQAPENLTIDQAVKGQPLPLKVTYQGSSAREAQQKLAQYIQQSDEQIAKELDEDLATNIKTTTDELTASLATQEKVAQEQKELRLKQIAQALEIAREANVQTPQPQQADNISQDSLFLLGSPALESMIKNESSRPLVLSDNYYKTKQRLLDIQRLTPDPQNMHAYRYVMKPDLPLFRDSPKKALTLILAVLLGGIVGAGIVLARNALKSYKH
ncbi:LPS O-antigen chain length determinant protein WzzB [Salmonella enterica]